MQGRHFSFFQGGKILSYFLVGGKQYEKSKIVCARTQKVTIFQIQGVANAPPYLPSPK